MRWHSAHSSVRASSRARSAVAACAFAAAAAPAAFVTSSRSRAVSLRAGRPPGLLRVRQLPRRRPRRRRGRARLPVRDPPRRARVPSRRRCRAGPASGPRRRQGRQAAPGAPLPHCGAVPLRLARAPGVEPGAAVLPHQPGRRVADRAVNYGRGRAPAAPPACARCGGVRPLPRPAAYYAGDLLDAGADLPAVQQLLATPHRPQRPATTRPGCRPDRMERVAFAVMIRPSIEKTSHAGYAPTSRPGEPPAPKRSPTCSRPMSSMYRRRGPNP